MSRRRKIKLTFQYSLVNSFKLIYHSLFYPTLYSRSVAKEVYSPSAIYFFLFVYASSSLLRLLYQTYLFQTPSTLFLGITSTVLATPFVFAFLWIISGAFFVMLRALKVSLPFRKVLTLICFSSAPALLLQLPVLSIAALCYLLYHLNSSIFFASGELAKSAVAVLTPLLGLLLIFFLLGILNLNLIFFP